MHLDKKVIFVLAAIVAACLPGRVSAQTSSINAFSPYSMYGIGEINTPGTLQMRAMGGAGVAQRVPSSVNTLNPASYSSTLQRSFLFNFGVDGAVYKNLQTIYSGSAERNAKTGYGTFNFHEIAIQFPLARGLGMGLSLNPYSSVGYRMQGYEQNDDVLADVGRVKYAYNGEGDITEVKIGVGWEIFKRFSIGAAMQYYWGDIDRNYSTTVMSNYGDGTYSSTVGSENYSVSRIKGQVGLQWGIYYTNRHVLTFGATYDFGGDLAPKVTNQLYINNVFQSNVVNKTQRLAVRLPQQLTAGFYYQNPKIVAAADYTYQNWGSRNQQKEFVADGFEVSYTDTHTYKLGVEYTPNLYDVRNYLRRVHYRVGFRMGDYYQAFQGKKVKQYAVTAGFGFPIRFMGMSAIDVGFEYGIRGDRSTLVLDNKRLGLVRQNYFKFSLGIAMFGEDYWFVKHKYD